MSAPETEKKPLFERYRYMITAFLVVAILGGAAVFILQRPAPTAITIIPPEPTATPQPTPTPEPSPTPGPIQVYVTGAVLNPETVVTIPYAGRAADAIDAAGGLASDADVTRVNMAQILRDGDQVHVYALADSPADDSSSGVVLATPSDSGIVYVNTATVEELEALPRIGPAMAQRIVEYREANGVFATIDDLQNVSGIGPATIAEIAPFVSLEVR
jgi:competence protein ComEA